MSQTSIPEPDTTVGELKLSDAAYTAEALHGALSGLAGVPKVAQMTRTEYEMLEVKDPATLYVITADV